MANVKKKDRVSDQDIIRFNHVGLSLKAIADRLGCHAATVTGRMKQMGITPFDTRRSFMEQVFSGLSDVQQEWLSQHLFNQQISVKDYIINLIRADFATAPATSLVAAPRPAPVLMGGGDEEEEEAELVEEESELVGVSPDMAILDEVELSEEQEASLHVLTEKGALVPAEVDEEGEVILAAPPALTDVVAVPAEVVEDDALPNPPCELCGEFPVLTGTKTCASCLDKLNRR